ncbi:MAG: gamma-glutamyl-phosphate reductase, partial [Clostridium sp.]|nr:gamma-glutamyl-phosphate reductase [Clostridium sp.]
MNELLIQLGKNASAAKYELQKLSTDKKNQALCGAAEALVRDCSLILEENGKDIAEGEAKGMPSGL